MNPPDLAQALRRTLEVDTAQVERRTGGGGQPSAGAPHSVRAGLFMPRVRAEITGPDGRGVLREARRFDRIEISTPHRLWAGRGKSPQWRYFDPPFRSSPVAIGDLYGYLAFVAWLAPQPDAVAIDADPTGGFVGRWSTPWRELPDAFTQSAVGFATRVARGALCEARIDFDQFIERVRFTDVSLADASRTEHFWMQMTLTRHGEAPAFELPTTSHRGDLAMWTGGTR